MPLLPPDTDALTERVKNAKPDLSVLKDYRKREEEFLRRAADYDEITAQRDAKKEEYDALRKRRLDEFMAGFNAISLKLKEMYQVRTRVSMGMVPDSDRCLNVDDHSGWQC